MNGSCAFSKSSFLKVLYILCFSFIVITATNTVVPIYKLICRTGRRQALNLEQHSEHTEEKQTSRSAALLIYSALTEKQCHIVHERAKCDPPGYADKLLNKPYLMRLQQIIVQKWNKDREASLFSWWPSPGGQRSLKKIHTHTKAFTRLCYQLIQGLTVITSHTSVASLVEFHCAHRYFYIFNSPQEFKERTMACKKECRHQMRKANPTFVLPSIKVLRRVAVVQPL